MHLSRWKISWVVGAEVKTMVKEIRNLSRRQCIAMSGSTMAAALAGCASSNENPSEDTAENDGSNVNKQEEQTEITFWNQSYTLDHRLPWVKDWFISTANEELNVKIEPTGNSYEDQRQKYLTQARQGTPDMIEGVLSHLFEYVSADLIEPITDEAKKLDHYDGYIDASIEALSFNDEIYGLPFEGGGRALVYRKDILEKYGYDVPETVEALHEIGREINKNEDDMWAYSNSTKKNDIRGFQEWISHVYQHEDALYEYKSGAWEVVPSADTLGQILDNWYYQIWAAEEPLANPDRRGQDYQTHDVGFVKGEYAMGPNGPWMKDGYEDSRTVSDLTEKSAAAHLPVGQGANKGTYLEVKFVGVNSHSSNKKAATNCTGLFASPESINQYREVQPGNMATPVHNDVESTFTSEDWSPFVETFKTGSALAFINWGEPRQAISQAIQQAVYGEDPYKAGEELHKELTNIAKELE